MTEVNTADRVVVSVTATDSGDWQVVSVPTGFQGIAATLFAENDYLHGFVRHEDGEQWEVYDFDDGDDSKLLQVTSITGTVTLARPATPYDSSRSDGARMDAGSGTHTMTLSLGSGTLKRIFRELSPFWKTFTSADASPSVAGYRWFKTNGSTPITRFDDMTNGQGFWVRWGGTDIVIQNNSDIVLLAGADQTLSVLNPAIYFAVESNVAKQMAGNLAPLDEDDFASDSALRAPSQQSVKAYIASQILDEDDMASNSATKAPSQQSIKTYVDNVAAGLNPKASVKAATTANITLSGGQTIDGVSVTAGDRVLVKDQSTASQNGLYVAASGSWSRALDMDAWAEVPSAYVWVAQGTANADTGWVCTADAGGTIGSTSVTWIQFGGANYLSPAAKTYIDAGTLKRAITIDTKTNADTAASSAQDGQLFWVLADQCMYTTASGVLSVDSTPVRGIFADRASFVTANARGIVWPAGSIISDSKVSYIASTGATDISDLGGFVPYGDIMPDHWATNTTPGTTDMTTAYQAALTYGAGKTVKAFQGSTYGISVQLSLKSKTYWDGCGSTLKALGVATSSFFSLWQPENGANGFFVRNMNIDCNSQTGMIGFILRTGAHDGLVDGIVVKNFVHDKGGVAGGRGFVVESISTVLDNACLIVQNIVCRSGYMGFAVRGADAIGYRHNLTIANIAIEDCDVAYWLVGNTTNYPFSADQIQANIHNVTAKNCGKQNVYTNGGGAFVADRACNYKMSNIVLSNDSTYGSIPAVWHGNGAYNQADITYHGDCTNFWDFRAYKESDGVNPTENTIQNSHLKGTQFGTCTDIAYIGSSTGSYAVDLHIGGAYDTVSSDNPVSTNLRQSDVWFDVFEVAQNARVIGRGDVIAAALFTTYNGAIARLGAAYFGNYGVPTYTPTAYVRDASTDMTGGLEISSFNPSIKLRDLSGSSYTGAIFQDGQVTKFGYDSTPTTTATWTYKYGWDAFAFYPLTDLSGTSGKATNAWSYTFAQYHAVKENQSVPTTVSGFTSCFNDTADNHYKIKNGSGTVKRLASALLDMAAFTPTTGQSITMTADHNIIDPAGTLAALTVTLPLLYDGQVITMSFSQAITSLTVTPNGSNGSVANAISAATAGQVIKLRYNSSKNKLFNA